MADLGEPDTGTAYYRSKDPIKNLKIKVTLNKITSGNAISGQPDVLGETVEMRTIGQDQGSGIETYSFKWQEKVFSRWELEFYKNKENCNTPLTQKYHSDIIKLSARGGQSVKRIFSYVDHDNFKEIDQESFMTDSPDEKFTPLSKTMTELRKRRAAPTVKSDKNDVVVPKSNIIDDAPSDSQKNRTHYIHKPSQIMYIMADVSDLERQFTAADMDEYRRDTTNEKILCRIEVDGNGVTCVQPDFNRGRQPYKLDIEGGRDAYEYTVDHDSKPMSRTEKEREIKMFKELYNRHTDFLSALVGNEFEIPPPDVLRLMCYGEILSAKNFEYDHLYIHYFLELPRNWYASPTETTAGVTQTCETKVVGRDDVAYFSYPFNFELFYKNDTINPSNTDLIPNYPTLFVEVLSLDTLGRYRTEGYGYLVLPNKAGRTNETIHCWRPVGNKLACEMRRFFIGGSPELEDPTYTRVPTTFDGSHLSKFGFRTEATGQVKIRLDIIKQSKNFLDSSQTEKKYGTFLSTMGGGAHADIMQVIEAFQRARQRMLIARENVQYIKDLDLEADEDGGSSTGNDDRENANLIMKKNRKKKAT